MARIAVTGASGFIGRHLTQLLIDEGHEVRGLARSAPRSGPAGLGIEFVAGDVRNRDRVSEACEGCEYIVHLAASFSPDDDIADIVERGTETVLSAAKESGAKRLVLLSCLGADAASESTFHASKWRAEMLIRGSGVPYTIIRSSLVVGRDDGVLRPLAGLISSLPVIPVPGNGQVRTQPIDVSDLCRCIASALTDEALTDESVSVGGPMFLTFRQLIDLVSAELGANKRKLLVPYGVLPTFIRYLPPGAQPLFSPARLAQFREGVVASPGIVQRTFDFEPANILPGIASYIG